MVRCSIQLIQLMKSKRKKNIVSGAYRIKLFCFALLPMYWGPYCLLDRHNEEIEALQTMNSISVVQRIVFALATNGRDYRV